MIWSEPKFSGMCENFEKNGWKRRWNARSSYEEGKKAEFFFLSRVYVAYARPRGAKRRF